MKRKGIRSLALTVCLTSLAPAVWGCGSTSDGKIEVEIVQYKPEAVAFFEQLQEEFNALHDDIQLSIESPNDAMTILKTRFVREDYPDIVGIGGDMNYSYFVDANILADISDYEGLGRLYADELGTIEIPEHIQNYFDYEAYGRDVRINEGGVFAPGGYVSAVPEGFKEYYHGPQDIPPEHRIFAYPEKAEPVHSILAALKRFQEAPPAPKKDKAGPSHEER